MKYSVLGCVLLGLFSISSAESLVGKLTSDHGKLVLVVEKSGVSTTYALDKKSDTDEMRDHLNDDLQVEARIKSSDGVKLITIDSFKVLDEVPVASE
jgi:hypothetical protein